MEKYTLYGGGGTRSIVVQMLLEEAGIPYELRFVDMKKEEHKAPEYLAINPAGYLPGLVTPDGEAIHETPAMLLYIGERHNLIDFVPPTDDPQRGLFLSKLFYHSNELCYSHQMAHPERYCTSEEAVPGVIEAHRQLAMQRWSLLDAFLRDNGPHHLGERFSILDMNMGLWAVYGLMKPNDIVETFPSVGKLVKIVRARPKSGHLLKAAE